MGLLTAAAAIATTAAGVMGARSQASAARSAANAQVQASNDANAVQREIYYDQRELMTPAMMAGADARARQMLMMGYSPDQVKRYLRSTSAAVGNGTPSGTGSQWQGGTLYADDGVTPINFGGETIDAQPGEDYNWVDGWNWQSNSPSYNFRFDEGQRALERSAAARGDLFSGGTGREITRYGQDYASNEWEKDWGRLGDLAGDGANATGTVVNVAGNYGNNAANNIMAAGQARATGYQQAGNAWGNFWQGAAGIPMYGMGQGWWGK